MGRRGDKELWKQLALVTVHIQTVEVGESIRNEAVVSLLLNMKCI